MGIRRPVAAGTFYAGTRDSLIRQIELSFEHKLGPGSLPRFSNGNVRPPFLVCPHAGYMYSGPVAAHSYAALESARRAVSVIIIGPNHTGIGSEVSIYPEGEWRTPLGSVSVDSELAEEIAKQTDIVSLDEYSHEEEHSIEVQLPFLQYTLKQFKFVPISMFDQERHVALALGRAIANVVDGKDVLLIASSDFTHYEPDEVARKKDLEVLKHVLELDIDGFYDAIIRYRVSACGYGPVATVMEASRLLGAKKGTLLKYATSGDITGDRSAVVGYASVIFEL